MAVRRAMFVQALQKQSERLVDPRLATLRVEVAAVLEAGLLVGLIVPLYDCHFVSRVV